jgi:hypothetical protein
MKTPQQIIVVILLSAISASAQPFPTTAQPATSAFGVEPIIHVTSPFRAKIELRTYVTCQTSRPRKPSERAFTI